MFDGVFVCLFVYVFVASHVIEVCLLDCECNLKTWNIFRKHITNHTLTVWVY